MPEPVFPADIPPLHKHLVEAVFCCEVDIFLHIGGVRRVFAVRFHRSIVMFAEFDGRKIRCVAPLLGTGDHLPPYSHIFHRLDPGCVIVGARFVQIENKVGGKHITRIVAYHDRTPGRMRRRLHMSFVSLRIGSEPRFKHHVLVIKIQMHAGIIHQRRYKDRRLSSSAMQSVHLWARRESATRCCISPRSSYL